MVRGTVRYGIRLRLAECIKYHTYIYSRFYIIIFISARAGKQPVCCICHKAHIHTHTYGGAAQVVGWRNGAWGFATVPHFLGQWVFVEVFCLCLCGWFFRSRAGGRLEYLVPAYSLGWARRWGSGRWRCLPGAEGDRQGKKTNLEYRITCVFV